MNDSVFLKPASRLRRRHRPRWFRALVWTAVAGLVLSLAWCGPIYYQIVAFDGVSADGNRIKADVGIVLGAKLRNDKPSPALRERLDHTLSLYRAGVFERIIVTGGLDAKDAKLTEAEGMRNYLREQGVPDESIAMDTKSYSTYENLLFARDIMTEHGWQSAVIVTHRYHGARAADIAGMIGYDPVQVSVTDSTVMNMAYHETREILAFTKWKLDKWRLSFG